MSGIAGISHAISEQVVVQVKIGAPALEHAVAQAGREQWTAHHRRNGSHLDVYPRALLVLSSHQIYAVKLVPDIVGAQTDDEVVHQIRAAWTDRSADRLNVGDPRCDGGVVPTGHGGKHRRAEY